MTQNSQDQMQKAPHKVPEEAAPLERGGLSVPALWLFAVLTGVTSAGTALGAAALAGRCPLPGLAVDGISFVILAVTVFFLFRICRTSMRWLPTLVIIIALPLCWIAGSTVPVMTAVSLTACIGLAAMLLAVSPKTVMYCLPLIPLCAYVVSLRLCRDPLAALICLVPFPTAAALAFGTRAAAKSTDGPERVGVICLCSLALALTVILAAAIGLGLTLDGGLSVSSLKALLEEIRAEAAAALVDMSEELAAEAQRAPAGLMSGMLGSETESVRALTAEEAADSVNSAINMLPGVLITFFNITSALAQCVLYGALTTCGYENTVRGRVRLFRLSRMAGITFLAAFITAFVTALSSQSSTLAGTVAENIVLILQPGLALCGFMRLTVNLVTRSRGNPGCLPFIVLLFAPLLLTVGASFLALYESGALLLDAVFSILPHDGDDMNPDDPDDADDPF